MLLVYLVDSYFQDFSFQLVSALIVEEVSYLRGNGRHDRRVEERVESGKQERADEDLYAGVDVTLATGVCERDLRAGSDGGELVLDGGDSLFHVVLPHIFLVLLFIEREATS